MRFYTKDECEEWLRGAAEARCYARNPQSARSLRDFSVPHFLFVVISVTERTVSTRHNIIDMEVMKEATRQIEEHQHALKPENKHRTAATSEKAVRMTKPTR